MHIEGEEWGLGLPDETWGAGLTSNGNVFEVPKYLHHSLDMDHVDSEESSWTLGTDSDQTSASSRADTPTMQSDLRSLEVGRRRRRLTTGKVAHARWPQECLELLRSELCMPM